MAIETETLVTLTSDIVMAHVSNNATATSDVAGLIQNVYAVLQKLGAPTEPVPEKTRALSRSAPP